MNEVVRALEADEPRGVMKMVVDAESGQILGCAILGIEGGEIMAMLQNLHDGEPAVYGAPGSDTPR
jgi:pyruvate/2-oxoglutarate dehydrogenase complex dihydrolipoamide dehydrogenase (E3) component